MWLEDFEILTKRIRPHKDLLSKKIIFKCPRVKWWGQQSSSKGVPLPCIQLKNQSLYKAKAPQGLVGSAKSYSHTFVCSVFLRFLCSRRFSLSPLLSLSLSSNFPQSTYLYSDLALETESAPVGFLLGLDWFFQFFIRKTRNKEIIKKRWLWILMAVSSGTVMVVKLLVPLPSSLRIRLWIRRMRIVSLVLALGVIIFQKLQTRGSDKLQWIPTKKYFTVLSWFFRFGFFIQRDGCILKLYVSCVLINLYWFIYFCVVYARSLGFVLFGLIRRLHGVFKIFTILSLWIGIWKKTHWSQYSYAHVSFFHFPFKCCIFSILNRNKKKKKTVKCDCFFWLFLNFYVFICEQ